MKFGPLNVERFENRKPLLACQKWHRFHVRVFRYGFELRVFTFGLFVNVRGR